MSEQTDRTATKAAVEYGNAVSTDKQELPQRACPDAADHERAKELLVMDQGYVGHGGYAWAACYERQLADAQKFLQAVRNARDSAEEEANELEAQLAVVTAERDRLSSLLGPLAKGDVSGMSGDGLHYVVCTREDQRRLSDGLHALGIDPQLREACRRERLRAEAAEAERDQLKAAAEKAEPSAEVIGPCEWYGRPLGEHDWRYFPWGKRCTKCKQQEDITQAPAEAGDGWISVEERLPDPGQSVLVFVAEQNAIGDATYHEDCTCSAKWHGIRGCVPTHWRPLPAPPLKP